MSEHLHKRLPALLLSCLLLLSACGNPAAQPAAVSGTAAGASEASEAAVAGTAVTGPAADSADLSAVTDGPSDEALAASVPQSGYIQSGDFRITDAGDGTAEVVGYTGTDPEVTIPAVLEGCTVTAIGPAAFFNQTHITSVTLPDTVTYIGDGAFVSCSGLTCFTMPDSVTALGCYVFARCAGLETVTLSSMLTELPLQTFYGCTKLSGLALPEGITVLGDGAFAYCDSFTDFSCTATLDRIGKACFFNIIFDDLTLSVKTLGEEALSGATISTLTFTDGLETLESAAFGDGNYDTVSFPASLRDIASDALGGCRIRNLSVDAGNPSYCTEDGGLYTKDETTLIKFQQFLPDGETAITFPDGLTEISDYAFAGFAGSLESGDPVDCTIPETVTRIGAFAFRFATMGTVTIPAGMTVIPENAFSHVDAQAVIIPDSVTTIAAGAFRYAGENLASITIPASVTEIGDLAFSGCFGLVSIEVAADNPGYSSISGMLYDKSGTTLIAYPAMNACGADGTAVIPDGTLVIGAGAFEGCSMLLGASLPDSVTTVEDRAFFECDALRTVTIGAGVTEIGTEAFGYTSPKASREDAVIDGLCLIGEADSAACTYAAGNDIAFYTAAPVRDAGTLALRAGETALLDQTGIVSSLVQYTSSDEHIVSVDEHGMVTAHAAGETTVVLSCGYDYITYPITVTGDAADAAAAETTADITGADYGFSADDYTELTIADTADFQTRYAAANSEILAPEDNNCINCYSGDEYKPILAAQGDERRIIMMESAPQWSDYRGLFGEISDGLYDELARYQCPENIVMYRGIPDSAEITGTGSSVADMKASIGTVFEAKTNLSTSVIHHVATGFAANSENAGQAVLEIYAPSDMVNGSYIASLSQLDAEYEFLINQGARFLILDAGVRTAAIEAEDGSESETTERYFKLLLLGNSVEKVSVNVPVTGGEIQAAEADYTGTGIAALEVSSDSGSSAATIRIEPAQYYSFSDRETRIYVNGVLCEFTVHDDGYAVVEYAPEMSP